MAGFLQIIKNDADKARKAGDKETATSLMTLYAEASARGKNDGNRESTDAEVLDMIQVFVKNIDVLLEHPCNTEFREKAQKERVLLSSYLPEPFSEQDLINIISPYTKKVEVTSVGQVMSMLKENFPYRFNSKQAASIAKRLLND